MTPLHRGELIDAGEPRSILVLARTERSRGNDYAASEYLRKVVSLDAENVPVLAELAALLASLSLPDEAIATYRRALTLNPQHVSSHLGLGWITRALHDDRAADVHFSAALSCLQSAMRVDPGNVGLQSQFATALRELRHYDESAAIYRRLVDIDAHHAASHEGLGWIAFKRGKLEEALEHFKAAAAPRPDDPSVQLNLAKMMVMMNHFAEAKGIYNTVGSQAILQARVRAAMGTLARSWQDWDAALEHFRTALELDPGHVGNQLALGRTLCDLSRWEDAEREFRSILEHWPQHVEALRGLAEMANTRGETDAALVLFETVLALAPMDHRSRDAIRRLKVAQGAYDWRNEVEQAAAVARAPEATTAAQLEAARTLVQYGLSEIAGPLLARIQADSVEARQLAAALAQMVRMGLVQPVLAGAAHPDPADNQMELLEGYLEKPVPGAETLLLVFAGTNHRTWITFTLLHRVLRKTGVSVVYVRDLRRDWYASGVVGLGENFDSAVEGFSRLAYRLGAKRVLTMGNCVGCLGALRFGLSLRAAGVLGFGPKLRPDEALEPDHKLSLRAFRERRSSSHQSIHTRYLTADPRPPVTLFFGEHCGLDATAARALTDVPGIVATAIPGSTDPDSLKDLLALGLLETVLQEFVATGTVSPELHARVAGGGPGASA